MDERRLILGGIATISIGIAAAMEAQRSAEMVVIKQRSDESETPTFAPRLDRDPRTKGQRRHDRRQQLRSVMKR